MASRVKLMSTKNSSTYALDASSAGTIALGNGLNLLTVDSSLAIGGTYDLPSATDGWGEVIFGLFDYWGKFRVRANGAVTILLAERDFEPTDTGAASGDLCLFDNGTNARFINRQTGAIDIMFHYFYREG